MQYSKVTFEGVSNWTPGNPSIQTKKVHPFDIVANQRNSNDVKDARRGIFTFPNGNYIYRPSVQYLEYLDKCRKKRIIQ